TASTAATESAITRRAGLRLRATPEFYPRTSGGTPLEDDDDELVLGAELERRVGRRDRRDPVRAVRERGHGHRLRVHADARAEGAATGDAVELDLERIAHPPHLD